MFYVGYLKGGAEAGKFGGPSRRAPGRGGIGGPIKNSASFCSRMRKASPGKGQGTDSFFPYQVGNVGYAFYGSHEKFWRSD